MKTKLQLLLICFTLTFALQSKGQTLIQFWDFNQIRPITGVGGDSLGTIFSYANALNVDSAKSTWPLTPAYSKVAGAKIVYYRPQHLYASIHDSILDGDGPGGATIYDYSSSNYSYFTSSDSGFAEGNGYLKVRNPSDSCYMYLYIPTTGYKGISMQYAISQSSTKGATYNVLSYSTDGGTTWKNLTKAMDTFNISGVYYPDTLLMSNSVTDNSSAWYPVQINFTSDASINNNANFILRFRMTGVNTTGTSGNDRYDNIAVWASSPAGIDEVTSQTGQYSIYPNPANSTVVLNGSYTGNKLVTVYSELGQKVDELQMTGKQTSFNISDLAAGMYFASIFEAATGKNYTVKFVKN
jgi:hypothetical protein